VAAEVEHIVAELPVDYALSVLPAERQVSFAMRRLLPADKGHLFADKGFLEQLDGHLRGIRPGAGEAIKPKYGVGVGPREPVRHSEFVQDLLLYFKSGAPGLHATLRERYGIDPDPLALTRDEGFRKRLTTYFTAAREKGRNAANRAGVERKRLAEEYGIDPK